jgi:hypothetical protein
MCMHQGVRRLPSRKRGRFRDCASRENLAVKSDAAASAMTTAP